MKADQCRMMKLSRGVTTCCVALLIALTSVSAVQEKLKTISDLKKINFGPSVPKHSLVLLHWFANTVVIDNNGVIWLTFDPNSGDYGAHHYGNYEGMLDPLPWGYQYYTVGNLNQETSMQLPSYVEDPPVSEYEGENRDRIIIRVREQNIEWGTWQMIDRVYITQHYDTSEHQGTRYDPDHTYQITTRLLRVIREFSVSEGQRPLLHLRNRYESNADDSYIRNTWKNLACLGLFLFIVIEEKYLNNRPNNRPQNNKRLQDTYRQQDDDTPVGMYVLQVQNRSENNYRQQDDDTPAGMYVHISHNRSENRHCSRCALLISCSIILIIVTLIISLSIYFTW